MSNYFAACSEKIKTDICKDRCQKMLQRTGTFRISTFIVGKSLFLECKEIQMRNVSVENTGVSCLFKKRIKHLKYINLKYTTLKLG